MQTKKAGKFLKHWLSQTEFPHETLEKGFLKKLNECVHSTVSNAAVVESFVL